MDVITKYLEAIKVSSFHNKAIILISFFTYFGMPKALQSHQKSPLPQSLLADVERVGY